MKAMPLGPIVNYLLQMDRARWDDFRARLKAEGLHVGDTIRGFIEYYIEHGMPGSKKKKGKDS